MDLNVFFLLTDNPVYRRGSEGMFVSGPDFKRGSIYSDHYPTSAPPRPPPGSSKRGSMNGQVNPALSLKEEYVTMNPLYEGQVMHHKDLEELNCSDFGVSPDQVVLDTRKDPEGNIYINIMITNNHHNDNVVQQHK